MSEMNKSQDVAQAARELERVRLEMETTVRRMQSRIRNFRVIAIIIAILLAAYFFFAYGKISQVNAEMAVSNVEFHLQSRMPQARKDLEKALAERAPEVVSSGMKQLLAMPDLLRAMLSQFLTEELEKKVREVEEPLAKSMHQQVQLIAQRARETKGNPDSQQEVDKVVDELAAAYRKEAQREVNALYNVYEQKAEDLVEYLKVLSRNEGLDRTGQLHRELVMTLLALIHKVEEESGTGGDEGKMRVLSRPLAAPAAPPAAEAASE